MKKILIATMISLGLITSSSAADLGFNLGASIAANVYEAGNAKEQNADATKNSADEGDTAEGLFAVGAVFAEVTVDNKFLLGLDYVPYSTETEEVRNEQEVSGTTNVINRAKVEISDMASLYAGLYFNENIFGKVGYIQADLTTIETLGTGGAYPDADLEGAFLSVGYERDLPSNTFLRVEATYSVFEDVTVTNSVDSTKKVTVSDIDGYGAKLSIGKSF